jgi:hypothetical protein
MRLGIEMVERLSFREASSAEIAIALRFLAMNPGAKAPRRGYRGAQRILVNK